MFFTDSLSWETTSAHNTMKKKTLGSFPIFESLVQQTLFQLAKFRFCDFKKKIKSPPQSFCVIVQSLGWFLCTPYLESESFLGTLGRNLIGVY